MLGQIDPEQDEGQWAIHDGAGEELGASVGAGLMFAAADVGFNALFEGHVKGLGFEPRI